MAKRKLSPENYTRKFNEHIGNVVCLFPFMDEPTKLNVFSSLRGVRDLEALTDISGLKRVIEYGVLYGREHNGGEHSDVYVKTLELGEALIGRGILTDKKAIKDIVKKSLSGDLSHGRRKALVSFVAGAISTNDLIHRGTIDNVIDKIGGYGEETSHLKPACDKLVADIVIAGFEAGVIPRDEVYERFIVRGNMGRDTTQIMSAVLVSDALACIEQLEVTLG